MRRPSRDLDIDARWVSGLLALVVFAVYGNSLSDGFVWDDLSVVVGNVETSRLAQLPDLFLQPDTIGGIGAPYYRPVSRATFVLDSHFYGKHPAGFHFANVFLHVLAVLALFFVSLELFASRKLAWMAALLFAVHPVNTEAVDFISARNNLLATCFVLASSYCCMKSDSQRPVLFLWLSAFLFFLGLLSKETALMLLPVLALYRRVVDCTKQGLPGSVLRLWPFAVFFALYAALRANALSGTAPMDLQLEHLPSRLLLNLSILPKYLALLSLPRELSISRLPPEGGYPITFWIVCSWVAVPAIGFWWVVSDQLWRVHDATKRKGVLRGAAASVLVALAWLTFEGNSDWRSSVSLFESEVQTNPSLAENHYNLCTSRFESGDLQRTEAACLTADALAPGDPKTLTQLGNLQQAQRKYLDARHFYQRAVAADPRGLEARYNLARLLENLGQLEEASQHYRALDRTLPSDHPLARDIRDRLRSIGARPGSGR